MIPMYQHRAASMATKPRMHSGGNTVCDMLQVQMVVISFLKWYYSVEKHNTTICYIVCTYTMYSMKRQRQRDAMTEMGYPYIIIE